MNLVKKSVVFTFFLLFFLQLIAQQPLTKTATPQKVLEYYYDNRKLLAEKKSDYVLRQAIADIREAELKLLKSGKCIVAGVYYLLGFYKCALNDNSGILDYDHCLVYTTLDEGNRKFIEDEKSHCSKDPGKGAPGNSGGLFRYMPDDPHDKDRPGVKGVGKVNQSDSKNFLDYFYRVNDTTNKIYRTELDFFARSFSRSEKTEAIRYFDVELEKSGFRDLLSKTDTSNSFLLYSSGRISSRRILNALEDNLDSWQLKYNLFKPEQLITIFDIPEHQLSREEKKRYRKKFKFELDWGFRFHKWSQRQERERPMHLSFVKRAPQELYAYKKEFLQFAFQFEDAFLHEGAVGYNNPYDYSIVAFGPNSIGGINHEVFHLLMHENLPMAPMWVNEGLSCLFEAVRRTKVNNNLSPINNFRIKDIRVDDLTYGQTLDSTLFANWDSERLLGTIEKAAIARYLFYYLYENHKLEDYVKYFVDAAKNGLLPGNAEYVDKLVELSAAKNLTDFKAGFAKFIVEQRTVTMKKGVLRPKYKFGLY